MKKILYVAGIILLASGCALPPASNPSVVRTVVLQGLPGNCYNSLSGTNHINFTVHLEVRVPRGNQTQTFATAVANSASGTIKFPISLNINFPTDTYYYLNVNIDGLECSRCGYGYGNPQESYGQCTAGYGVQPNQGARPRWAASFLEYSAPAGNFQIASAQMPQITNVASTCACVIPN